MHRALPGSGSGSGSHLSEVASSEDGAEPEVLEAHDGVHALSCEALLHLKLLLLKDEVLVVFDVSGRRRSRRRLRRDDVVERRRRRRRLLLIWRCHHRFRTENFEKS